jgi:hypothetical protein
MGLRRRTVFVTDKDWNELTRLARHRTEAEDERVSASELVRRGIAREVEQARKGEEGFTYIKPY